MKTLVVLITIAFLAFLPSYGWGQDKLDMYATTLNANNKSTPTTPHQTHSPNNGTPTTPHQTHSPNNGTPTTPHQTHSPNNGTPTTPHQTYTTTQDPLSITTTPPNNVTNDLETEVKKVYMQFELLKLSKNKTCDLEKELLSEIKVLEKYKLDKEEEEDTINAFAFMQKLKIQNDIIRIETGIEIFLRTIDKINDYIFNNIDYKISDHSNIINIISDLIDKDIKKAQDNLSNIDQELSKGDWNTDQTKKTNIKEGLMKQRNLTNTSYKKWIGKFAEEQQRIEIDQKELNLLQGYIIESNLKVLNSISTFITEFLPILDLYYFSI